MSSGGDGGGGAGMVGGGLFGAIGSLMEGSEKSQAYDRQAQELTRNAAINRKVGEFNVTRQQIIANRKIGGISADYAASGIASDSGSVAAVLGASHANSELDRLNIMHGAEVRSTMMEDRATVDRDASTRATQMGYLNAFGSLFMAGGKAGSMSGPNPYENYGMSGGYGSAGETYGSSGFGSKEEEYA